MGGVEDTGNCDERDQAFQSGWYGAAGSFLLTPHTLIIDRRPSHASTIDNKIIQQRYVILSSIIAPFTATTARTATKLLVGGRKEDRPRYQYCTDLQYR